MASSAAVEFGIEVRKSVDNSRMMQTWDDSGTEIAEVMVCIVRLHFNFSSQTAPDVLFDKVMAEMC